MNQSYYRWWVVNSLVAQLKITANKGNCKNRVQDGWMKTAAKVFAKQYKE